MWPCRKRCFSFHPLLLSSLRGFKAFLYLRGTKLTLQKSPFSADKPEDQMVPADSMESEADLALPSAPAFCVYKQVKPNPLAQPTAEKSNSVRFAWGINSQNVALTICANDIDHSLTPGDSDCWEKSFVKVWSWKLTIKRIKWQWACHFQALMTVGRTTKVTAHTRNLTAKCRGISSRKGMLHLWVCWIAWITLLSPKATVQGSVAECQGQRLGGIRVYISGYRQLTISVQTSGQQGIKCRQK